MINDDKDPWPDPAGPDPDDPAWLTPAGDWTWDKDSLMMGEYVGFALYLRLRDRLCTIGLPVTTHNLIIQELVDTHDAGAVTALTPRATLVVNDADGVLVDMAVLDHEEMGALTDMM